jgi:photosystem II stability/assembly factor-like uncharacterized protein
LYRLFIFFLFISTTITAQVRIDSFKTNVTNSFRGLSVPSDNVIWVSGTKGTVGRSTDAGKTWEFIAVPNMQTRDFRDIHAFDAMNAIVLSVDSPGYLLKTVDGGKTWKTIFTDTSKGVFFDAMDFNSKRKGVMVGDPINNQPYILEIDFDNEKIEREKTKLTFSDGEAFFAASGTNIQMLKKNGDDFLMVTGGKASRFGNDDKLTSVPITQGKETSGANSIAIRDKKNMIIAGGDFGDEKNSTANCFYTMDGGKTWIAPNTAPVGYKSCVIYITKEKLVACGTTGVDVSEDGGKNWRQISKTSFQTVQKAAEGNAVYLSGPRGRIAKLIF